MSMTRSGSGADDGDAGSWASETLPIAVRKELLERELKKLGFRKAKAQGGGTGSENGANQQQGDSGSSHPQADGQAGARHGD